MFASSFLVCARLTACVRALNAHSLEGTLSMTSSVKFSLSVLVPQNVSNGHKRTTTMLLTSQLYYSARFDFHDSVASPGNDVRGSQYEFSSPPLPGILFS